MIANDLSPAAVEVIKRNVKINGLAEEGAAKDSTPATSTSGGLTLTSKAKVQVHEADAW